MFFVCVCVCVCSGLHFSNQVLLTLIGLRFGWVLFCFGIVPCSVCLSCSIVGRLVSTRLVCCGTTSSTTIQCTMEYRSTLLGLQSRFFLSFFSLLYSNL